MSQSKKYDLVLYGATGFTGSLAVQYVAKTYGNKISWAVAGRSKTRTQEVADREGQGLPDVIIADSEDKASLIAMAKTSKVIATTAGPFARYSTPLVEACVSEGVDYCDITGEAHWVREMIAQHDDAARKSGARIVHLCGHDSVPWDLSALMLAKKLKKDHNTDLARLDFFDHIRGAPSGGTLETVFGILFGKEKNAKRSAANKALGFDPLLKLKDGSASASTISEQNVKLQLSSGLSGIPRPVRTVFIMAGVNALAFKRSNALNNYGKRVTYCEGQSFKNTLSALKTLSGLALFGIGLFIPPIRWLLRKFVLPKPGEGPSPEAMEQGFLHVLGVGKGEDGSEVRTTMSFNVDAGYKDTARMLVESALSLSLGAGVSCDGGVYTPGSCQKEVLLDRLMQTGTEFKYHDEVSK